MEFIKFRYLTEIFTFQTVFDPFFISTYNVIFTSLPIVIVGIFDKDVDAVASIRFGRLFTPGIWNTFFNRRLFAFEAMWGLFSSLVVAGLPAGTFHLWLFSDFSSLFSDFLWFFISLLSTNAPKFSWKHLDVDNGNLFWQQPFFFSFKKDFVRNAFEQEGGLIGHLFEFISKWKWKFRN